MASRQDVARVLEAEPFAWVEITDRANKEPGSGWDLGERLWSPAKAKKGDREIDAYRFMRRPTPGDLVLHFVDEGHRVGRQFAGVSRVAAAAVTTDEIPPRAGSWEKAGVFMVIELDGYQALDETLDVGDLVRRRGADLMAADAGQGSYVFAQRRDGVRLQLQYLTRATQALLRLLAGELEGVTKQDDLDAGLWIGRPGTPGLSEILVDKLNAHVRSTAYLAFLSRWYERARSHVGDGDPVVLVLGPGGYTGRIGSVKPNHRRLVWLIRDNEVNDQQARRAIVDAFAERPALRTVLCVRPDPAARGGLSITDYGVRVPDPLIDSLHAEGARFGAAAPFQAEPTGVEASVAVGRPLDDVDWSEVKLEDVLAAARIDGAEEPIGRALAALASGMNVIFVGPPGTGKTTLATAIFQAAGVDYDLRCASDHWTTYDTIGGYFPEPDEEGRSRLVFRSGALLRSIQEGRCAIVDEINRADIDKAFGELFTLFGSKTSVELRLPLRALGDDGVLRDVVLAKAGVHGALEPDPATHRIEAPASWRMIGSMNDADRASLKRFSLAFARRFAMVPVRIPSDSRYRALLSAHAAAESERLGGVAGETMERLLELCAAVFVAPDGLAALDTPLGPGFAITVLDQAIAEIVRMPERGVESAFLSALELYVAPQFQGLATKHRELVELVSRTSQAEPAALGVFEQSLVAWTGGAVAF